MTHLGTPAIRAPPADNIASIAAALLSFAFARPTVVHEQVGDAFLVEGVMSRRRAVRRVDVQVVDDTIGHLPPPHTP
jgi:hypothetical protein